MGIILLLFIIFIIVYLALLIYVNVLPKVDIIKLKTHNKVVLWYTNYKGERKWKHLFNY